MKKKRNKKLILVIIGTNKEYVGDNNISYFTSKNYVDDKKIIDKKDKDYGSHIVSSESRLSSSLNEALSEAETRELFGYDNIIAYDSESFYPTTGDTTDYFYRLAESKNSDKNLFSTCFEFGTIGDSFVDSILSLKYTVDENRQHWYPSDNKVASEVVRENYNELFYPTETQWREKTVADFKIATEGVLNAKLK